MLEYEELVNVTLEAFTTEEHRAGDGTEFGSIDGLSEHIINIDGSVVMRAVDSNSEMMPLVVGIITCYRPRAAVVSEVHTSVNEGDFGAMLAISTTCGEDRTIFLSGLEPEHDCLVLISRA